MKLNRGMTTGRLLIASLIGWTFVAVPAFARGDGQSRIETEGGPGRGEVSEPAGVEPAVVRPVEVEPVKVEVSTCDLGQRCQLIEATSRSASLTALSSYSTSYDREGLPGPSVIQQEFRLASRDLNVTLHFLVLSGFGGSSQSVSYMIDGRPATRDAALEVYARIGEALPGLGLPATALTRATFLSCAKEVVADCGGTHNDGDCETFRWSAGGNNGTKACVLAGGAGCGLAHPWTLIGCWAAVLF
ncbi:MAG: hypothetical protein AAF657_12485 [Acidobacteriota bacterium]